MPTPNMLATDAPNSYKMLGGDVPEQFDISKISVALIPRGNGLEDAQPPEPFVVRSMLETAGIAYLRGWSGSIW